MLSFHGLSFHNSEQIIRYSVFTFNILLIILRIFNAIEIIKAFNKCGPW